MKTNLTSQITLNHVNSRYYKPANAFEQALLTRLEKLPTSIYENADEASRQIAREIADTIKQKESAYKPCVMVLTGGATPHQLYAELVRLHREEGLSFRNVIVFNLYEFYPLAADTAFRNLKALKDMLLDHVDIDPTRIFSPSGTLNQNDIFSFCEEYERKIAEAGGIDICLLGIGRLGNIAFNEPGSRINSITRLILLDADSRAEAARSFGNNPPLSSITMGIHTILSSHKIYLMAWGEDKAKMIKACVEGAITDNIPASFLQMHNNVQVVVDLS